MAEGKEHGELANMDAHHCRVDPGAHVSREFSEFPRDGNGSLHSAAKPDRR